MEIGLFHKRRSPCVGSILRVATGTRMVEPAEARLSLVLCVNPQKPNWSLRHNWSKKKSSGVDWDRLRDSNSTQGSPRQSRMWLFRNCKLPEGNCGLQCTNVMQCTAAQSQARAFHFWISVPSIFDWNARATKNTMKDVKRVGAM